MMSKEWMHYTPEQAEMLVAFHASYGKRDQRQDVLEQVPAQPCQVDPCSNNALWRFNGYAVCDECILAMARMNSDNASAFLPALARMQLIESIRNDYWLCGTAIMHLDQLAYTDQTELARCTTCHAVLCGDWCKACHNVECENAEDTEHTACQAWYLALAAINEVKAKYHLM